MRAHDVINAVCQETGTPVEMLLGPRRCQPLASYRQIGYLLCHHLCPQLSYPQISRAFKRIDHTPVWHGIRSIQEKCKRDPKLAALFDRLYTRLKAESEPVAA